jgi:isopentenyl diphosphate isomerase/L-lactate dehydrogenase-like FMN-dependent dehydrogenase
MPAAPYADRLPALEDLVNVFDFDAVAKSKLARYNYDYVSGGVDDEITLRRNREAYSWITLHPRLLRNVSNIDMSLTLFGQRIDMPILIAPTGSMTNANPIGDPAMARVAGAMKTIMVVSNSTTIPLAKITEAATGPLWFQLYPAEDSQQRVENAVALGCKAIAVTIETPYDSHRERLLRYPPERRSQANSTRAARVRSNPFRLSKRYTAELTWPFIREVAGYAKVPVLVKGVLSAEDAVLAIEHGASGVIVSNHGGRYLDSAPATIEVLPSVVDAVKGRVPVLIDGGIRRGTDVLKALGIGATAVLEGRPTLWGLAAYGEAGAKRVLELLQTELALAMGLSGRANLAAIDRSLVKVHAPPVTWPPAPEQ